jgi:hypothetical protein
MAGLVPAIHVFLASRVCRAVQQAVDARVKPGHDAPGAAAALRSRRNAPKNGRHDRRRAAGSKGERAPKSVGNHADRH